MNLLRFHQRHKGQAHNSRSEPIQNNIICWNYLYFPRLLEKASDEETCQNLLRAAAVHTSVAWGHINFAEEKLKDALGISPSKSIT